jgi:hypothetical protein
MAVLGTRQERKALDKKLDQKLTEAEKAEIRQQQQEKDARLLAAILENHPGLTKEEALEMLQETGFL